MTIGEYFQNIFNFPVNDGFVEAACAVNGVDVNELFGDIDDGKRDLVLAEMLVMMSRASMGWSNKAGSDAFSMTLSGETVSLNDRMEMREEANRIYRKYGMFDKVVETNAINIY